MSYIPLSASSDSSSLVGSDLIPWAISCFKTLRHSGRVASMIQGITRLQI